MLSIIIPTLNEEEWIKKILDQLNEQIEEEDEIIVVDSDSKDRTKEIARKLGAKVINYSKKGKGLACNYGAKHAKNDIIVFLDADSILAKDYIHRIKTAFKKDILAVGGVDLYFSDSKINKAIYNFYGWIVFCLCKIHNIIFKEICVPSNNSAFKKEIFLNAGGYKPIVCEEAELMKRLPKSRKVKYDPNLKVWLSDRRFKKHGFIRTLLLWAKGHWDIMFGKGMDSSDYKEDY